MRRWFLSYNSHDLALMQGLEAALLRKDPGAKIFLAPKSLRVGGFWLPELAVQIAEATAFVLLVGPSGLGPWQVIEYYEALDRHVKEHAFPVILLLLDGQSAPGLPFLRQLHWITTADLLSENCLAQLMEAASGAGTTPGVLWRHTAPYRGLIAMSEGDADFFFGRGRETADVIGTLAAAPDKLPVLLGNSGVGKSSVAQAGVLAAFVGQTWPETTGNTSAWPQIFAESRRWCVLKVKPGAEPVRALVEPFVRTWQFDPTDPRRETRQIEWIENLVQGRGTLRGLLDATEDRLQEQGRSRPPAFLLYIDQGEELYISADERQQRCFSKIISEGLADPRLRALMSMRADFFGELQKDEPLFSVHRLINVAPLREAALHEVVGRPAQILSARFETDRLAASIAQRAAEESTTDAGALPLLSYLLDDMWRQMIGRDDGVLRLPEQAIDLGAVLVNRANSFLATHPNSEDQLRRILTLKLATVREDGEPTRRRAFRSEFSDQEWRLVSELADNPNRLLVTAAPEAGQTYAEVAHEAIFRRWSRLREWIAAEREFLAWRGGLETARRAWQATGTSERLAPRDDALLLGAALGQAESWYATRANDLAVPDRAFIVRSIEREAAERKERESKRRRALMASVAAAAILAVFAVIAGLEWHSAVQQRLRADQGLTVATKAAQGLEFSTWEDRVLRGRSPKGAPFLKLAIEQFDRLIEIAPTAEAYDGRAFAYLHFGEADRAIADYNQALALNPNLPAAYDGRGNAYKDKGDLNRAVADFDHAIALNPKVSGFYSDRGLAYRSKGDLDRSIADYTEAVTLDPKYSTAFYRRGLAYRARDDLDHAIADFTQSIALDSDNVAAYVARGNVYGNKGELDRAVADFDQAIALDPTDAVAYRDRGLTYAHEGDLDRAIIDYTKAIALSPKYANAYNSRGFAYQKKGDLDRAIADYTRAITLNPKDAVPYENRGNSYIAKDDLDRAVTDFTEAITLNPKYARAYNGRGFAYQKKGDLDRAIADFTQAIALNPKYPVAYGNRGFAYWKKDDPDRAIADYKKAIALDPKDAIVYNNRGSVYQKKGDLDRAIADFTQAIALNPKYARPHFHRGEAYNSKGDYVPAIADFSEAIRLEPQNPDYLNARCWDRALAGRDLTAALADCNEALRLRPNDHPALNSGGLVQLKLGAYDNAIADYSAAIAQNATDANSLYGRGLAKLKKGDTVGGNADMTAAKAIKPDITELYAGYGVT